MIRIIPLLVIFVFLANTNAVPLNETNDLRKFLKNVIEDHNLGYEKKAYKNLDDAWKQYMTVFGKEYTPEEKEMRKAIFKKNKEYVEKHNELFKQGKVTHSTKLNHLSDRTHEELERMNGFLSSNLTHHAFSKRAVRKLKHCQYFYKLGMHQYVPDATDWRKRGFVTAVKNQGGCGCCYAFAGNGALEALHMKRKGKLIDLSVQNILDCTWNLGNKGCHGGFIHLVYDYAQRRGIESEDTYPFTMNGSGNCMWKKENVVITSKGCVAIPEGDEVALKHAVALHGPVAAAIGSPPELNSYGHGFYHTLNCGEINHAVLIVGYGVDPGQGDYWLLKNSFGEWWGEDGYVRIVRNKNNMCDVATKALFPT